MTAKSKTSMHIIWGPYNVDGAERAFLGTDTTANAETFGYVGDFGLGSYFNAQPAASNDLEKKVTSAP